MTIYEVEEAMAMGYDVSFEALYEIYGVSPEELLEPQAQVLKK